MVLRPTARSVLREATRNRSLAWTLYACILGLQGNMLTQARIELQVQHSHTRTHIPHHDVSMLLQQMLNPGHGKDVSDAAGTIKTAPKTQPQLVQNWWQPRTRRDNLPTPMTLIHANLEKSSRPQSPPMLQKILNSSPFLVRLLEDTAALQASANCPGISDGTSPLHCLAGDMLPVLQYLGAVGVTKQGLRCRWQG